MAKPYEQDVVLDANGKPLFDAIDTVANKIASIQKTIEKIQSESFKGAKDFNKTIEANVKALQQGMAQLRTLTNQDMTARRQARALAEADAKANAQKYGTTSTRVGYEFEREKALGALRAANSEKDRIAALKAVELANARLQAIERIAAQEERIARAEIQASKADVLASHRQRLALSRQYAEQQIKTVGAEQAVTAAKESQVRAEQRLAAATALNRTELRQNLELENARLKALERIVAQQNKLNGMSSGGGGGGGPAQPPKSRLQNILSPGYAGAAFARTSIYGAAAAAAYSAYNAVQTGVTGAIQMEDEFAKLQAISASTDTQMQTLKSSILEVGRSSRIAVVDLIKISETLAQAGVNAEQMESVLKAVSTLAIASGSTPDEAVQLITSAMGAFQLQASEAARVANLMTEALNRTKLTVQQTGQAIQYVGSTAYEQNISLETLLATIGAIAQAGVKSGSTIGTGFRQFLVDLQEPSKKLSEQLTLLGLSSADVDVKVRGLPAVLETLQKAGFGAAQAYEGLEVRAAAFYLTAKNNVDIIDNLQLSFSYTNAAAAANEKAMNSLAAQWQRFKNILQEGVAERLQGLMHTFQDFLEWLSNRMEKTNAEIDRVQAQREKGRAGYAPGATGAVDYALNYDFTPAVESILERTLNGQFNPFDTGKSGLFGTFGTQLRNLGKDSDNLTSAQERLATQVSKSSQAAEDQKNKISELDKEMLRLTVQKESLSHNDARSAAETATLTSRFGGLANQLVVTGNRYDDLINAMKRYRLEQQRLLGVSLGAQNANLVSQISSQRGTLNANIAAVQGDKGIMGALRPDERAALSGLHNGVSTQEFSRAFGILTGAIERLTRTNANVAQALNNKIVGPAGALASSATTQSTIAPQVAQARVYTSEVGQFIINTEREVEALITQMQSLDNGSKDKANLTSQSNKKLDELEKKIQEVLKRSISQASRQALHEAMMDVTSFRNQIKALNTATAEETKAAKAAEREAARGPKLTQAQLDKIAGDFLGLAPGSGVRTAAQQHALFLAGKTPADAGSSSHSNGGLARDFPTGNMSDAQARQLAESLRQHFKNLGVDVFVQFETGRGRHQGTGPHIHTSANAGTRFKGSAGGSDAAALDKFEDAMGDAQTTLDKQDFAEALKDLAASTTIEAARLAYGRAEAAMKKVNEDLITAAKNDVAKAGIGPGMPQYALRMKQLQQEIDQNTEEFNRKIAEATVKRIQATLKAAQTAFDASMVAPQRNVSIAQGAASGLGYASLQGRVPDYTKQLADRQASLAQERLDRERLAQLPALIAANEKAKSDLEAQLTTTTSEAGRETLKQQIDSLSNSLENLKTTRDSLAAAFGAEGLLPQTLGQGLAQAIDAYKQLNGLNNSFTQQMNMEMTGAIQGVHNSLEQLFEGMFTGSLSAGQAFLQFGRSIITMIGQIAAKLVATQIINALLNLVGATVGGSSSSGGYAEGSAGYNASLAIAYSGYNGGRVRRAYNGGSMGGGMINSGHDMRDSVMAMLSKGEWVVNRRAVDSVGSDFMHDLNKRGAAAVKDVSGQNAPKLEVNPRQEVNVWMIKPEERPQMGPNDVLVTWQQDVLNGGESRKLIEHVSRDAR